METKTYNGWRNYETWPKVSFDPEPVCTWCGVGAKEAQKALAEIDAMEKEVQS